MSSFIYFFHYCCTSFCFCNFSTLIEVNVAWVNHQLLSVNQTLPPPRCSDFNESLPPVQLTVETTGASSLLGPTSWAPGLQDTPKPPKGCAYPLTCATLAAWTLCSSEIPTAEGWTRACRPPTPTNASTPTTSTSATHWWPARAATMWRGRRSPGGGSTSSQVEALHQHGCSSTIRASFGQYMWVHCWLAGLHNSFRL